MLALSPMRRFFADSSFWNTPIGADPKIDPASRSMLALLSELDPRGFWLNLVRWTIPIYEVNAATPRRRVHRRFHAKSDGPMERSAAYLFDAHPMGHGQEFARDAREGRIPIPVGAKPDPENDSHIALVDWENGWIWDMWAARVRPDGEWECNSGMKYRADGSGVFDPEEFVVQNGESIHPHGPSRAAGVPALAGTIMYDEIRAGHIEHKLGFATQGSAYQQYVFPPACWTDGGWPGGLPEGAVVQLDPTLDLDAFGLSPAARTIARALQEYGAVNVDVAGGHCLYAQGLYADPLGRSWEGILECDELTGITLDHYRVLQIDNLVPQGMGLREPDGVYRPLEPISGVDSGFSPEGRRVEIKDAHGLLHEATEKTDGKGVAARK